MKTFTGSVRPHMGYQQVNLSTVQTARTIDQWSHCNHARNREVEPFGDMVPLQVLGKTLGFRAIQSCGSAGSFHNIAFIRIR